MSPLPHRTRVPFVLLTPIFRNAEKTKEILANLREKVAEVERDAAWEAHLRRFMNNSANSELAGEERGSTINVKKLLANVDGMRIEEQDPEQERL